ncbi:hypothetical protein [Amycolatopsis sp. cmx-4-61]|uniref:hypothetical protein n=1 Tax=Amycolatopsis sp. cmx-4-61 TaxID=2790937 RepID=UPI00397CE612
MTNTSDDARPHTERTVIRTRSPHDPARHVSAGELLAWWEAAQRRTVDAACTGRAVDVEDYWTELAVGTRLAAEVTAGRWVVVARLLRAGAVGDWSEIGAALDMSDHEAIAGFLGWVAGQGRLYQDTGIGLTRADADDLERLAVTVDGGGR